jgi:hypothetical protein
MLLAMLLLKEACAKEVERAENLPQAAANIRAIDVERLVHG